jgi:uncharacterized membrane protein YidH (DUF202 family)
MDDILSRGWDDLVARLGGPFTFRLIIQPAVAVFLAIRSGLKDAKEGRPVFFWSVVLDPAERRYLLRQGWQEVGKLFIVAVVLDVIYQVIVLRWVYVGQALIVATMLAIVPYLVVRGLANRIAVRFLPRRPSDGKESPRMEQDTAAKHTAAPDQMKLALDRTFLAHERTLMAWVRTASSLITFGFTLYKFFFYLQEQEPGKHAEQLIGPRTYGLIMIGIGVFTLAAAAWQHHGQMKRLRARYAEAPFSLSLVLAALITVLGILGFITAVLRE